MTAVIPFSKRLGFLHRARKLCILLGVIYALLVALGTTPFAQGQYVFSHPFLGAKFFNWSCDT